MKPTEDLNMVRRSKRSGKHTIRLSDEMSCNEIYKQLHQAGCGLTIDCVHKNWTGDYDSTMDKVVYPTNWNFLTGDKTSLYNLARHGYLIDNKGEINFPLIGAGSGSPPSRPPPPSSSPGCAKVTKSDNKINANK